MLRASCNVRHGGQPLRPCVVVAVLAPADYSSPFGQHHRVGFPCCNIYSAAVVGDLARHRTLERPRVCLHVVAICELVVCTMAKRPHLSCLCHSKAALSACRYSAHDLSVQWARRRYRSIKRAQCFTARQRCL